MRPDTRQVTESQPKDASHECPALRLRIGLKILVPPEAVSQNPRRFRSPDWRAMTPDPKQGETAMTIKTNVKAGGITYNHNETFRR